MDSQKEESKYYCIIDIKYFIDRIVFCYIDKNGDIKQTSNFRDITIFAESELYLLPNQFAQFKTEMVINEKESHVIWNWERVIEQFDGTSLI